MVLKVRIALLWLLISLSLPALSQISFDSDEQLVKAADQLFDSRDYAQAKPLFSQLLSKDALNPDYNYRFGVCILFTEADPLKPLPYIEGGASSKGVNIEAYYFLGKAYQFNYRFGDAIIAYQKAKDAGFQRADIDLDKCMEECRNGNILYNANLQFVPASDKEVIASEFYRPYDFRKLKGKVIPMPPNFKTKYDEKNLKGTVIYTPTNSQTLVYASYGDDGANGKDLYRVNRLPNGELALPQRLPNSINTRYDEDYAFFDEETQMLFFASKGHNTMGGYDVFSSRYNATTDTWTTPSNLQYPINSPFDDFLYVSDPEGKVAFFTTERNVEAGKLRVMKMMLNDPQQVEVSVVEGTFEDRTDAAYNYAALTVFDPLTNEVVGKYRTNPETGKYILILPTQSGYRMDVGPREADGFKFNLDIPKTAEEKPLQQHIVYDSGSGNGTVTVTNYFDATGTVDSIAFNKSLPLSEIEAKMVAMPEPSERLIAQKEQQKSRPELNQKKAENDALLKKQAAEKEALAKGEKLRTDSIRAANEAQLAQQKELNLAAEKAKTDSIKKVEELALKEKLTLEKEALAKAEKLRSDSIRAANEAQLAQQKELNLAAEKAKTDSIRKAEELALKEKKVSKNTLPTEADSTHRATEKEFVALALEKARQDSIRTVDSLAELQRKHLAERTRLDSLNREAEIARSQEVRAKFVSDSLATVELAAKREQQIKLDQLNSVRDSLQRASSQTAEAKDQLAEQTKPNIAVPVPAENAKPETVETVNFDEIFKEMAAREAQILDSLENSKLAVADTMEKIMPAPEKKDMQVETAAIPQAKVVEVNDTTETETVTTSAPSESELFLQTIAKLEAQKKEQDELIRKENEAKRKTQSEQARAKTEANVLSDTLLADSKQRNDAIAQPADSSYTQASPTLLKSNADPQAYLSALNEIEKKIADEAAVNKNKSYQLKELPPHSIPSKEAEPLLQAKIAADRKALEEHQKIALEKEKELQERMAHEKVELGLADTIVTKKLDVSDKGISEEIVEIEKERTEPAKPEVAKEELPLIAENVDTASRKTENVEKPSKTVELPKDEVSEASSSDTSSAQTIPAHEQLKIVSEEQEVLNAMAEFDLMLGKKEIAAPTEPKEQSEEVTLERPAKTDSIVATKSVETKSVENQELKEDVAEEEAVEEDIVKETVAAQTDHQVTKPATPEPAPSVTPINKANNTGSSRTMEVALRDYSKREVSFEKIENPEMRMMVKRMRSEDIGRVAVLKNMKNEWVTAGRTQESLKSIKDNLRNQDVLTSLPATHSKEEYTRPPFDRNTLRKRMDVHYKIGFQISTNGVSETVSQALSPEQAITFSMPQFAVESGYYETFADADSDLKEYRRKGFPTVRIITYLKNEQVPLSDVLAIPFID